MKRRVQHSEIPPAMVKEIAEAVRIQVARVLGTTLTRIKSVKIFDPKLEGRSAFTIDASPPLTDKEFDKVMEFFATLSALTGARKPFRK